MSDLTDEQIWKLAALERDHSHLIALDARSEFGETMLQRESEGTRAYFCARCGAIALVELDGSHSFWVIPKFYRVANVDPDRQI